jgi:hypothetical protein
MLYNINSYTCKLILFDIFILVTHIYILGYHWEYFFKPVEPRIGKRNRDAGIKERTMLRRIRIEGRETSKITTERELHKSRW